MGTIDGMDVHHKDNNPLNNDPDNLEHMDRSENRREPRLRERRVKQDKDIKGREGTQPIKYELKILRVIIRQSLLSKRHFEKCQSLLNRSSTTTNHLNILKNLNKCMVR